MTRTDLQQLAELRINEAGILLANQAWDGAYYLAGYAVECALKACIAKQTKAEEFPDKKQAEKAWRHDFNELVAAAGIESDLKSEIFRSQPFKDNWNIVRQWSEQSRYRRISQSECEKLFAAMIDAFTGVLPWIKLRW